MPVLSPLRLRVFATGLAAFALLPARAAAAPGVTEVGWWSRQPGATAPQGGFAVADAPDAPISVAALRVSLENGVTSASIELTEAGGQGQDIAAINACLTGDPWQAKSPGPISEAPKADCTAFVALLRAGTKWTGDLTPLLADKQGEISVMLVPGEQPGAGDPLTSALPFEVRFNPPALTLAPRPVPTTTTTTTTKPAAGPPPPTTAAPGPTATTAASPPSTAAPRPGVTTTRAAAPTTTGATATTRAASPVTTAATAPVTTLGAARSPVPSTGSASNDGISVAKAIVSVLIALLAGAAAAGVRYVRDNGFRFRRAQPA